MRAFLVLTVCLPLAAQSRKGPPVFEPNDTEGLLSSPNPQIRHAWKRKVFWRTSIGGAFAPVSPIPAFTAAERQRMAANLDALVALFKATPTGSAGEGFWVNDSRTYGYAEPYVLPTNAPFARFPLVYSSGLFPFYHEDVKGQNGQWRLSVNGETESVYFYFNRHPEAVRQQVIVTEPRGATLRPVEFYPRPRETGRLGGLPVYDEDILVVARAGRDLWAPAPLGRVLKAALPLYEQDRKSAEERMAGLRKTDQEVQSAAWEQAFREQFERTNASVRASRPENYETRRKSMEREIVYLRQKAAAEANPPRGAEGAWYWNPIDAHQDAVRRLAALTPSEAARPACFAEATTSPRKDGRYQMRGDILAAGASPECRELVMTNWDYFDATLPRPAPQLLTIVSCGRCAKLEGGALVSLPVTRWDTPPQGCVQHAQMWRELDWARFAALVQP